MFMHKTSYIVITTKTCTHSVKAHACLDIAVLLYLALVTNLMCVWIAVMLLSLRLTD
jgi:hypothetical protein